MLKSVLLVGGSGFLGTHLINEFLELDSQPQIHVFDVRDLPDVSYARYKRDTINVHIGDLTSEADVARAIKASNPDVVVHSASPVHGLTADIYSKVNVDGTRILIDVCKRQRVPTLVFTSSAGVIFNGNDLYGAKESWLPPLDAMDAYNGTKLAAERMVLEANGPDLKTVALRPAGIFGPGDRQMIPSLRLMAARGHHCIQLGNNLNLFDVTYVGNVAYAHVLAAQRLLSESTYDVAGECFFITNDSPIYFWSFAREIWKRDGNLPRMKIFIPKSLGIILGYLAQGVAALLRKEPTFTAFRVRTACATRYYDITKARTVLGYAPKWSLQEALSLTLNQS